MPRHIYILLIDCFLCLSVACTFLFEHVRSPKKTVTFDKDFHKNKVNVRNKKKYLFVCRNSSTKGKRISSKGFILKHHKVNHLPNQIPNNEITLLRTNRKSFLTLNKFKIFSNDIRKDSFSKNSEDGGENEQENEQNRMSEKNDKWRKYYEDKRKKEILKDLDSNVRKKGGGLISGSPEGRDDSVDEGVSSRDSGREDHRTGEEGGQNEKDRKYYGEYEEDDEDEDDDEEEDDYDSYDTGEEDDTHDVHAHRTTHNRRDAQLNYPYDHEGAEEKNLFFANSKNSESAHGKFYDDRRSGTPSNPPSINESINNIFSSRRTTKDFPLFFPLNNKPFENSNNKYFDKICSIPPNELINRFFENTSERVKESVKNIIFNIIGNIQKYTIETSILITYDKIYNFLLQIILTGYMIKNADYRLSLNESLYDQNDIINRKEDDLFNLKKSFYGLFSDIHNRSGEETLNASELSKSKNESPEAPNENAQDMQRSPNVGGNPLTNSNLQDHRSSDSVLDEDVNPYSYEGGSHQLQSEDASSLSGKNDESDNFPMINTKNYIIFLRKKIKSLEMQVKKLKENKTILNEDLLSYIKSLTDVQLRSLTDNIGPLVLDATKKIVELVIQGMTLNINKNSSNELIYVSGSVLTYICFWQLIIGYTLREMEIRDELSDYLKGS
ncbi:conserved Plasmodium protein, unknown function [Plasmodium knowlesi strain H]|uniref:Uncharacterized protein n=3 Tax=Plasmodium knowlesi TaxID=5850 RepID=A0A5K1U3F1_PLAKH|nr:conserved protein, unknown function [Plasmodium knowlesi strain H]OTN66981.1 Uncharacterized protein PKNOH_S07443900 [Plasmodium knowlesi]CAA9988566.1 conserved protein, unknown function [Plasmodium knowlesi strain H]SBO21365.1 conserved Plasmodium protein, unknown function [Plasmodium knowlesi strain H]SBO21821.1 conserved Plasmodium protein, unknown function [Plasmodium knowlesi strain H]VVS78040.1 conserved protein, unknown function [Plasmodium knowlesi strain H]|eukprot:XP_002259542.1 hypothetical protein, conserved in Plasmodium species [Plasmodium knowlesi strain H]